MSHVASEIASQPETWRRAADLVAEPGVARALPQPGERVAVVGCGTSYFMAQAYAALRESAGQGETDAFAASEFPAGRALRPRRRHHPLRHHHRGDRAARAAAARQPHRP